MTLTNAQEIEAGQPVWLLALADALSPNLGGWEEQPKQAEASAMAGRVDDLLFGGAAGGGKSEWLIEYVARQMETFPGNRGVIFRRVFPSLSRTIVPRAKLKLHGRAKWNANEHTFTFPNGSVLELASLQYKDTVIEHQGAEYGVIAFEEITEFMQSQVEFLIGRLRSTIPGVNPHLVATTNPGGTGHKWVKRWWIKPDREDIEPGEQPPAPGEAWRPRASKEQPRPRRRAFIPSRLEDNPALMKADPGYVDRLNANSNLAQRKALREGDWDAIDAVEGALWTATDLDGGRVNPDKLREIGGMARRVLAVDPSDGDEGGDEFGVCLSGRGMDGLAYVLGSWAWTASPRKMAERAVALYYEQGCDALVIEKNHGGKWMVDTFHQVDDTVNVKVVWASDNKRTRAEPVAAMFEHDSHALHPYRARMVGHHPELEEELTTTEFVDGAVSPNRLDAMVWGITETNIGLKIARRRERKDERYAARR